MRGGQVGVSGSYQGSFHLGSAGSFLQDSQGQGMAGVLPSQADDCFQVGSDKQLLLLPRRHQAIVHHVWGVCVVVTRPLTPMIRDVVRNGVHARVLIIDQPDGHLQMIKLSASG